MHSVRVDPQELLHVAGAVPAHGSESVHPSDLPAHRFQSLASVGLRQSVEEQVFPLEGAANGSLKRGSKRLGQSDQQGVGQVDDVGRGFPLQPGDQLEQLFFLKAALPLKHGQGQGSQLTGVGLDPQPREELQHGSGVPNPVEQPGSFPKQGVELLEIDAQAAEKHPPLTHIGFVGQGRGINGQEGDLVAQLGQLRGQGIVSQATAAVHAGCACGNRENLHGIKRLAAGESPAGTR